MVTVYYLTWDPEQELTEPVHVISNVRNVSFEGKDLDLLFTVETRIDASDEQLSSFSAYESARCKWWIVPPSMIGTRRVVPESELALMDLSVFDQSYRSIESIIDELRHIDVQPRHSSSTIIGFVGPADLD